MRRVIETDLICQNGVYFLKIRLQGVMSGAVVADGIAALDKHKEYAAGVPTLWDLRDIDLSHYTMGEMDVAIQLLQNYPARLNSKVASLVRDRGAMLLARLWEVYGAERFQMQRRAFLSLEEAVAWLTSDAGA